MYIITRDGTGDFTTLQAAVDAVETHPGQPTLLVLRMETFDEAVTVHRSNLRIIGEARNRTVITHPVRIAAENVTIENLTIRTGEGEEQKEEHLEPITPVKPTCYLCGDETLAADIAEGDAYVEDCTLGGSSAKSYVASRRLSFTELCMRPGDRLYIRFGQYDAEEDIALATSPYQTYTGYLSMFIDAARRQGAEPVLVLPETPAYAAAMRALADYRGVRLLETGEGAAR